MITADHKRKSIMSQFFRLQKIEKKRMIEFVDLHKLYQMAVFSQNKNAIDLFEEKLIELEYKIGILQMRKRMMLCKLGANKLSYITQN